MRTFLAAAAVLAIVGCTNGSTSESAPSAGRSADRSAAVTPASWPMYHGNRARTGLSTTMPAFTGHLAVTRKVTLDGAVYGSPIVVGAHIIVATENNSVYAFTTTGVQVWKRHLGTPSPASERPCGNIDPLGITGSPIAYGAYVYVAPEYSGSPPTHQLVALRLDTGAVAWHRSIDFAGVDRRVMQQRGALALEGGRIWVPFGGLAGDCGDYKGRLVAIRADGTGTALVYTVPTAREGGIWTPPGPSVDSHGWVYASVGNGAATSGTYDHTDSVLKIDGTAHLNSYFAPTTWASDNATDADLGSQGPALVGGGWIFIAGKSGTAYVLRQSALGGIGGQVSKKALCTSFGGTAVVGATVYVPCTDGLRAVTISSTGVMSVRWHSTVNGSPVVGAGRVWSINASTGYLYAVLASTGTTSGHIAVGTTTRFATPALYGNKIIVPTFTGITIVTES